jgi:hypothetical protein
VQVDTRVSSGVEEEEFRRNVREGIAGTAVAEADEVGMGIDEARHDRCTGKVVDRDLTRNRLEISGGTDGAYPIAFDEN